MAHTIKVRGNDETQWSWAALSEEMVQLGGGTGFKTQKEAEDAAHKEFPKPKSVDSERSQ